MAACNTPASDDATIMENESLGEEEKDEKNHQEKLSMKSIIDGQYRVIKRFGNDESLEKQVYLVENILDKKLYVIKLYMPNEELGFWLEVEANLKI